jgi:hypothetical protein
MIAPNAPTPRPTTLVAAPSTMRWSSSPKFCASWSISACSADGDCGSGMNGSGRLDSSSSTSSIDVGALLISPATCSTSSGSTDRTIPSTTTMETANTANVATPRRQPRRPRYWTAGSIANERNSDSSSVTSSVRSARTMTSAR